MTVKKSATATKAPAKSSSAPKVFDVAKPGKSAPSITSKPVLISNRPLMQDPMVTEPAADEPAAPAILPSAKKVVIKPLHTDVTTEEPAADTPTETAPEPADVPAAAETPAPAETAASEEPEPAAPAAAEEPEADADPPTAETQSATDATPAAVAGKNAKADEQLSPEQTEAALKAAKEHAVALQKMIESKEYFLPINSVEKRRSKQFVALGTLLIIVLTLAWGDVALDAGLISINSSIPHTHYIGK